MNAEFRVIAVCKKWTNYLHEPEVEVKQYLQEKVYRKHTFFILSKFYWKTIDYEIVPSFAWISHACFGDENSGWKSKFEKIPNCNFIKLKT